MLKGLLRFQKPCIRLLHTSVVDQSTKVSKELLSKLRKKTGFTFSNCKTALKKCDNDLAKAEAWLREEAQKQGWAKATKLQGRAMSQGIIALVQDRDLAVMVEVNCETDFVAKNEKFQSFVSKVTHACAQQGKTWTEQQVLLDSKALNKLPLGDKTVADEVALQVGDIGENLRVRRLAAMKIGGDTRVGHYIHAGNLDVKDGSKCIMGKYGALVSFKVGEGERISGTTLAQVGQHLAQHVVGMNPKTIGDMADVEALKQTQAQSEPEEKQDEVQQTDRKEDENKDEEFDEDLDSENQLQSSKSKKENSSVMVFQELLIDPDLYVYEFLDQNNAEVVNFVRFECGEQLPDEES